MTVKNKIIMELVTSYFFPWQRKRRHQVRKFAVLALGGAATVIVARSVIRKFNE